ncbi:hypothetical protein [Paraburkholderia caribensis]|uniref:hypothetical protein n=1 Tax=Paraburkholderia caribensis TaxID=75105 RepID=UPI0034D1E44E
MINLSQINSVGVAQQWPSRERVIDQIAKTTPWSIEPVTAYNRRDDVENAVSAPPHGAYIGVGVRLLADAQAAALKCAPWERAAIDALGYILLGNQLDYFWHVQFRKLFPNHSRPLRMMDWKLIVESMAMLFSLGRREEATYQGYLAYSVLQHSYQLKLSYEKHHRRVHAFMLRLFADWQEGIEYQWLSFAYDEPIYEGILERWRERDPEALKPWLLAACDRHTHESKRETESKLFDCSAFPRTPIEILFLFRLRELIGLKNPVLHHPLMEPPFDKLPEPQSPFVPDPLVDGTLARVRADWPEFDRIVALDALKTPV